MKWKLKGNNESKFGRFWPLAPAQQRSANGSNGQLPDDLSIFLNVSFLNYCRVKLRLSVKSERWGSDFYIDKHTTQWSPGE